MSTFEEHEAEQAMITAMCEAGTCDHPHCIEERHQNELVERSAPRWAWNIIDETLAMDEKSKAFDATLRDDIAAASVAMIRASETDDEPISRAQINSLMEADDD